MAMLDWTDVPGETPLSDCEFLMELVKGLPDYALIVVLGTLQGRDTLAMASVCHDKQRVVTVDRFDTEAHFLSGGWIEPDRAAVERYAGMLGLEDRVEIVQGDTGEVGRGWNRGAIALLYVDASHDYDSVLRDLTVWAPLAAVVALHDYAADVIKAANDYFGRQPDRLKGAVAVYVNGG